MYLFHSLVIISIIYWMSVALAELVLVSQVEERLPRIVRVGLGYLLGVAWFAGTMKLLSARMSWTVGLALFAVYVCGRNWGDFAGLWRRLARVPEKYLWSFIALLIVANVFFLPLHIAGKFGPFTEGGGDISVYADVAKYLTDHELPAYGWDDLVWDITVNKLSTISDNAINFPKMDPVKSNPPTAEYQSYKVVMGQRYTAQQFSLIAQWFFLAGETNYVVFYSLMAFFYALTALSLWAFFRRFGMLPAWLAFVFCITSHGLISVFYNMYMLQSLSLMCSSLFFAVISRIYLFSIVGVRTYLIIFSPMLVTYFHFIGVMAFPFLLSFFPIARNGLRKQTKLAAEALSWRTAKTIGALAGIMASITASVLILLDTIMCVGSYIPLVQSLFKDVKNVHATFGDTISMLSSRYVAFVLGFFSQQHTPPFVFETTIVSNIVQFFPYVFFSLLFCYFASWIIAYISDVHLRRSSLAYADTADGRSVIWYLILSLLSFIGLAIHYMMTQSSLYAQAKGAQDGLVIFYAAVGVLPFAVLYALPRKTPWMRYFARGHFVVILVVCLLFLAPRFWFAFQLGYSQGRGTILDPSFFEEAKKIKIKDRDPLVMFEPRVNSDIYLSIQPFFGSRMFTTRHLILANVEWIPSGPDPNSPKITMVKWLLSGFDTIKPADISHLWMLWSRKSISKNTVEWTSSRLLDQPVPSLLIFGSNYELRYKMHLYNDIEGAYIRSGTAAVYIPADAKEHSIEFLVHKVNTPLSTILNDYNELKDTLNFATKPELFVDENFIRGQLSVNGDSLPRLLNVFSSRKEFAIRVRVDGTEIFGFQTIQDN